MIRDLHLPFTCSLFRFELVVLNRSDLFDVIKLPRFADLGENKRSISDSDRVRPSQVVFESRKPVAVVCRPGKKKETSRMTHFGPQVGFHCPKKYTHICTRGKRDQRSWFLLPTNVKNFWLKCFWSLGQGFSFHSPRKVEILGCLAQKARGSSF